jgi:NLR family CARD domain-containing protein 3
LLSKCFELDWSRTKIARLIKDENERAQVKELLRKNYRWFRESYKYISGLDPQKDLFCVSLTEYSNQVQQMYNMVDGTTLKLADLDLEFIATNAASVIVSKYNPERALVRHNWLEIFVRLCQTKYIKNGAGGPTVKTWTTAMTAFLRNQLLPYFKQFDSHAWRKQICWQESVDLIIKISLQVLKAIFVKFSGRNAAPGAPRFMSLSEFQDMIVVGAVVQKDFNVKLLP